MLPDSDSDLAVALALRSTIAYRTPIDCHEESLNVIGAMIFGADECKMNQLQYFTFLPFSNITSMSDYGEKDNCLKTYESSIFRHGTTVIHDRPADFAKAYKEFLLDL